MQPTFSILSLRWIGPGDEYLVWATNTDNNWPFGIGTHIGQTSFPNDGRAHLQYDGNFIVFNSGTTALWTSVTNDNPDAYLVLDDDPNMTIYDQYDTPIWSIF